MIQKPQTRFITEFVSDVLPRLFTLSRLALILVFCYAVVGWLGVVIGLILVHETAYYDRRRHK